MSDVNKARNEAGMTPEGIIEDDATRFHEIANRLFFKLYQSSNLMHKTGTSAMTDFGATTQQWAVLGALARPSVSPEGLTVKELLEYLMVSRQSLTAVLDRLAAGGLVERLRSAADGRLRQVRLTTAGQKGWARMQPAIRDYYRRALAGLSVEESYLLMRLLDRLAAGLAQL